VATTKDDQKAKLRTCRQCGAERALDQRYCISCGARLGSLPAAIRGQLGRVVGGAAAASATAVDSAKPEKYDGWPFKRSEFMPSPRTAAAAVLVMLGLGVALGSVTQQLAQSAGFSTILLESPPPAEEEAPEVASVEPEVEETTESAPAAVPSAAPSEVPLVEEPLPSKPPVEVPVEEELPTGMPEIKHVFVIMLGEGGYEETFGEASQSKFLGEELPAQGELLSNYFAVTKGQLANQIALLSGQGPTPETAANCPNYGDVAPGTESAEGQVEGNGCAYPATTKTLPGQLAEAKLKWKAYVEGIEDGAATGQPATCRHPALGTPDPNQATTPEDPYVTWRNPFVYFHSIVDGPECAKAGKVPGLRLHLSRPCLVARRIPQNRRPPDQRIARLQGRRHAGDHLCPGAAGRRKSGRKRLLHQSGLPQPAASRQRSTSDRAGAGNWRRRPRRPAPTLALRRTRHD
jgi:hypothetical protein